MCAIGIFPSELYPYSSPRFSRNIISISLVYWSTFLCRIIYFTIVVFFHNLYFSVGDEELDGKDADFRAVVSTVCLLKGRVLPYLRRLREIPSMY